MEKREKLNCTEYAAFADYCNEKGLRIVISGDIALGLEAWEKVENGKVFLRFDDADYIDELRNSKQQDLMIFDSSSFVNEFFINEISVWLDKATRMGIRVNIEDAWINGDLYVSVWSGNTKFEIPVEVCNELIRKVETYAKKCFDSTSQHRSNIMAMQSAEDINNYNFNGGYPDKLHFKLNT